MNGLTFTMSLLDRVTAPLRNITRAVNQSGRSMTDAFSGMATGVAGIMGSVASLNSVIDPAREFTAAMRSVESLGTSKNTLKELGQTALITASTLGQSASEIVDSAYSIQSGMGEALAEGALPRVTAAASLFAKATKADTATATNYFASMYGVFQRQADAIGQEEWIENLTSKTSKAILAYKTDGMQMAGAFAALGATGEKAGQSLEMQIATLGRLQSMGLQGSEAATQYKSFLSGMITAGDELKMKFTKEDGSLLDTFTILEMLEKRFGKLSKVSDKGLLKKALGSDEAMAFVEKLIDKVPTLRKELKSFESISGLGEATKMAMVQVEGYQRFGSAWKNLMTGIGIGLNQFFEPLAHSLANVTEQFAAWLYKYPNIARWIGYIGVAIVAVTAAASGMLVLQGVFFILSTGLAAMSSAALPVAAVIVAIGVLGYAIYKVYKNWDWIQEKLMEFRAFRIVAGLFKHIGVVAMGVFRIIAALLTGDFSAAFDVACVEIKKMFASAFSFVWDVFKELINSVIEKINLIPGIDIELLPIGEVELPKQPKIYTGDQKFPTLAANQPNFFSGAMPTLPVPAPAVADLSAAPLQATGKPVTNAHVVSQVISSVPRGGLQKHLTQNSATTSTNNKTTAIGTVVIQTKDAPTPQQMSEWQELQAG